MRDINDISTYDAGPYIGNVSRDSATPSGSACATLSSKAFGPPAATIILLG